MTRFISIWCALILVLLATACKQGPDSADDPDKASGFWTGRLDVGTKMPHFTLPSSLDGSIVDSDEFAGKVLLVTFFATR